MSRLSNRRALCRLIALCLFPAPALALEPIGPVERMHPVAGESSAYATVALSPEGRRLDLYLSDSPTVGVLWGRMDLAPFSPFVWSWPGIVGITLNDAVRFPAVAMSAQGEYAAAWTQLENVPGAEPGVFVRLVGADGLPRGEAVRVDGTAAAQYWHPAVATNRAGSAVLVVWTGVESNGHAVRARYIDPLLQLPLGEELRIDLGASQAYGHAAVAMAPFGHEGKAWVAWTDGWPSGAGVPGSVYLRALDQYGLAGDPVEVALQSHGDGQSILHELPALAIAPDGSLLVAWRELTVNGGELPWSRVMARRFDAQLLALGPAFPVSEPMPTADSGVAPQLAFDADGGFVILWAQRDIPEGPLGLRAMRFGAAGAALETFDVQPVDGDQHLLPRLAIDADGDLSVAWTRVAADGSVEAVLRRFRGERGVDVRIVAFAHTNHVLPGERTDLFLHAVNVTDGPPEGLADGRGVATGLVLDVAIPPPLALVGHDDGAWDCSGTTQLHCRFRSVLPVGEAVPLRLEIEAGSIAGTHAIEAQLRTDQHEHEPGDNGTAFELHIADTLPDAIAFGARSEVARGSEQISEAVTLTGFDRPVMVTVSGGEFSLNGEPFGTGPADAVAGDSVRVRHIASEQFASATVTTLAVGGVMAEFVSVTEIEDLVPDPFAFALAEGVARGASVESAEIEVQGINGAAPISIEGGEYSIDGAAYTAAASVVGHGQRVRLRHTSAAGFEASTRSTLSIGGVEADFVSLTEARDVTPDAFAFVDRSGISRRDIVYSNAVTVTGINDATPVSISGGGGAYSVNGGPWSTSAGKLSPGDSVRLRLTASNRAYTTVSTRLEIGGVADTWSVTTGR